MTLIEFCYPGRDVDLVGQVSMFRQRKHLAGEEETQYNNCHTQTDSDTSRDGRNMYEHTNYKALGRVRTILAKERENCVELRRRLKSGPGPEPEPSPKEADAEAGPGPDSEPEPESAPESWVPKPKRPSFFKFVSRESPILPDGKPPPRPFNVVSMKRSAKPGLGLTDRVKGGDGGDDDVQPFNNEQTRDPEPVLPPIPAGTPPPPNLRRSRVDASLSPLPAAPGLPAIAEQKTLDDQDHEPKLSTLPKLKRKLRAVKAGVSVANAIADGITIKHSKAAKKNWRKFKADHVAQLVITEQLALEHTEQVKNKYEFLVKDYQPKFYYFECIFLIEKLILTGLLIFVTPGSIAQSYVATLTAFAFCVIQTKYMPYDALQDNLLKQLAEVQLLMTLLISIILRTDLRDEALTAQGYDLILLCVNVLMVPGFLFIAAAGGVITLISLIISYTSKRKIIKQKQFANTKEGRETQTWQDLRDQAKMQYTRDQDKIRRQKVLDYEAKQARKLEDEQQLEKEQQAEALIQTLEELALDKDESTYRSATLVDLSLNGNPFLLQAQTQAKHLQSLLEKLQAANDSKDSQITQLQHVHKELLKQLQAENDLLRAHEAEMLERHTNEKQALEPLVTRMRDEKHALQNLVVKTRDEHLQSISTYSSRQKVILETTYGYGKLKKSVNKLQSILGEKEAAAAVELAARIATPSPSKTRSSTEDEEQNRGATGTGDLETEPLEWMGHEHIDVDSLIREEEKPETLLANGNAEVTATSSNAADFGVSATSQEGDIDALQQGTITELTSELVVQIVAERERRQQETTPVTPSSRTRVQSIYGSGSSLPRQRGARSRSRGDGGGGGGDDGLINEPTWRRRWQRAQDEANLS